MLSDCKPRSFSGVVKETGLSRKVVEGVLYRLWREERILRTEKPLMEAQRIFKGRGGVTHNLRKYHLYVLKPEDRDHVEIQGMLFVKYVKKGEKSRGRARPGSSTNSLRETGIACSSQGR